MTLSLLSNATSFEWDVETMLACGQTGSSPPTEACWKVKATRNYMMEALSCPAISVVGIW
jgi:hypothetical protein